MSSRQDQLHSYQYSQQRVVSALVTHDPDPSRSPFRRVGSTALVSVLIALIALGGTAAYAAFTNGGGSKPTDATVVYVEKETGAQFIYQPDGKLHPVLNYSSALLILGSPGADTERVSRKTLAKMPRGALMGIAGAPDALPDKKSLTDAPWVVCTQETAGSPPRSTLVIGHPITGGTSSTTGGLLVRDPTKTTFLVYGNRKLRIPDLPAVRAAFGWENDQPVDVAAALVNALPEGAPLAPLKVAGRDALAGVAQLPGALVGDLIKSQDGSGGSPSWAVAMADGVAGIPAAEAALLGYDLPESRKHSLPIGDFVKLKPAATGQAIVNEAISGHPVTVPSLLSVTDPALPSTARRLCLSVNPKDGAIAVAVGPEAPPEGAPATGSGLPEDHRVSVKAGTGVLVEAVASPTAAVGSGTISVVTDEGRRYPIATPEAKEFLGFQGVAPQRLPAGLVALLPVGPALGKEQALKAPAEG